MAYYLVEALAKEERFPELSERLSRTAFPRCGPPPLLSIADVLLRVLHLSERTPVGNAFSHFESGRSVTVNVQVKLPPGPISPESKASTPAGSRTLAACMALDGSAVTVWITADGLRQRTAWPAKMVTAAGTYMSWLFMVTSAATSPLGPSWVVPWRPPK